MTTKPSGIRCRVDKLAEIIGPGYRCGVCDNFHPPEEMRWTQAPDAWWCKYCCNIAGREDYHLGETMAEFLETLGCVDSIAELKKEAGV